MLVGQLIAEKITGFFKSDGPSKKISMLGRVSNRQNLAVFVFCFKIHALLLSNSRAAVLETAFFVHGNCCQLFHNFFSIKLGIYCCRRADVNNFVCTTRGVSAVQSVEIDHRQS